MLYPVIIFVQLISVPTTLTLIVSGVRVVNTKPNRLAAKTSARSSGAEHKHIR